MLNGLLNKLVARFKLDKFVQNVRLVTDGEAVNSDFVLKLNKTKYAVAFDAGDEFKDELAFVVNLLS